MRGLVQLAALGLVLIGTTDATAQDSKASLLAEARAMAAGNPVLLDEIAMAEAEVSKGVLGSNSAISLRRTIPGGASWAVPVARRAGEPLVIAVRRVGAAPVTLSVVDAAGRQLCADTTSTATLGCRIAPGTGALSVRVANPGMAPAEAMLLTN